ncbi:hypothetical protein XELAEV_18020090mg [Xenopus laevis]|uniref:Uncharacterized protein n=1 Tax=Xenopus laevis TaxID=8355 RepID=A0A974D689_XENLA|nr:hypothetical protein XELAEV_18020090mg [Xenopus laevis]
MRKKRGYGSSLEPSCNRFEKGQVSGEDSFSRKTRTWNFVVTGESVVRRFPSFCNKTGGDTGIPRSVKLQKETDIIIVDKENFCRLCQRKNYLLIRTSCLRQGQRKGKLSQRKNQRLI